MTQIIPGTINGVENTSTFLSRVSEHTVITNTTSSVVTEPVKVRAICVAPIVKTVPVNFFATTTYQGTTSTKFIGSATFIESAATLETRAIGTGTSVIRAQWPGQGRWAGFDFTTTGTVFLEPGFPFTGTVNLVSGNNPIYQLNTGTLTASLSTGTTATGSFVFKEGALTLATVPITSGRSVNWTFDPNQLSTSTISHSITAEWTGGRLDNIAFYGKESPVLVQDVNTASLVLVFSTSTITVADELRLTAVANTSSVNRAGVIEFKRNTTSIGTGSITVNSGTVLLAPGSFTSGTYQISATYLNSNPLVSTTSTLIVNNRANWPGTFTLTGNINAYQLANQTFTFTTDFFTATSGNVILQEVSGVSVANITSATFSTSTISFNINPNNYAFTATNTHNFRIFWAGQTWTPNVYYPYNSKQSNTLTQTATALISLFANTIYGGTNTNTVSNVVSYAAAAGTSTYSVLPTATIATITGSMDINAYTQVNTLVSAFTSSDTSLVITSIAKSTTTYNISAGSTIGTQWFPTTYSNGEPTGLRYIEMTYSGATINWIDGQDKGLKNTDSYLSQNWPNGALGIEDYWFKVNDVRNITTGTRVLIDVTIKPCDLVFPPGYVPTPNFPTANQWGVVAVGSGQVKVPFPNGVEVRLTNAPYTVSGVYTYNNEKYITVRWGAVLGSNDPGEEFAPYAFPPYDNARIYWGVDNQTGSRSTDVLRSVVYRNDIDPERLNLRIRSYTNTTPQTSTINSQAYIENNILKNLVRVPADNGIIPSTNVDISVLKTNNLSTGTWDVRALWVGSRPPVLSNTSTVIIN